ncbi:uncharacterized protein GGS25DRAFT_533002 [Hypoxylon fragiforme]|uniref:uncharacterized protein n=1 Tax=Hypoxylon fragiforme TaxID=63214 RepID=UPI0020C6AB39|nr:uncharacterized protein GGS25DRAFT_533002 [Hypoxylon fragiforme]KAI2605783.1 hypothetical protein GGS25DRAFT_533002 [Hypoxylon fragiforme]
MAPQKPRCTFKECKTAAQRIVGDCGFCDGHFCAKHRLLEDHKCSGLEDVSMNPANPSLDSNSASSSDFDEDATEWWLVGLGEYLSESGLDEKEVTEEKAKKGDSGSGLRMLTRKNNRSARRSRTSATRHSSRQSERKSSGVYKRRTRNSTAERHRSRRNRCRGLASTP